MLTIVATVCFLYSNPHKCKEIHLSFAEEMPAVMACMSPMPMIELAKWFEEKAPKNPDGSPKMYLKRYTCVSGEIGKDI